MPYNFSFVLQWIYFNNIYISIGIFSYFYGLYTFFSQVEHALLINHRVLVVLFTNIFLTAYTFLDEKTISVGEIWPLCQIHRIVEVYPRSSESSRYHPFCIAQKNRCNPRLLLWRKHASFGFCKNSNILISPFVMLILLLRLLHLSGWERSHFWFSVNHFSILKNILNCFLDCFIVAKVEFVVVLK